MAYRVKEIFYTLQGEGARAGRAAVFCRFAGCNLWTGREADRSHASCPFCDTDFVGTDGPGGGVFATAADLADAVCAAFPHVAWGRERPYVVFTGGEPALQLDTPLLDLLHGRGYELAVETNGTVALVPGLDWVTVSPKAGAALVLTCGNELKVVWPQHGLELEALESLDFDLLYLQPRDGADREGATALCVEWCRAHPRWRLGLQTHKLVGIP